MEMDKINTQTAHFLDISISAQELEDLIISLPKLNFIHIQHSSFPSENLISLVRREVAYKPLLVTLANYGFHLYVLREGVSSFVRHRRIPTLWRAVLSGNVSCDENLVFHQVHAPQNGPAKRLLVVFSSIASSMYASSLMRHFEPNFKSIAKHIPTDTAVLRIADMGGVVGSFYLNSNALPKNEFHVSKLIKRVQVTLGLEPSNVVLYGASKGGTAATYYSLMDGYRAVAVDPILSDTYYEETFRDSHFTKGTFPETKQAKFDSIVRRPHPDADLAVICSEISPQFPIIKETLISHFDNRFVFLNSLCKDIKDHPDVGPNTLPHMLSQLNLKLAGLKSSEPGLFNVT